MHPEKKKRKIESREAIGSINFDCHSNLVDIIFSNRFMDIYCTFYSTVTRAIRSFEFRKLEVQGLTIRIYVGTIVSIEIDVNT